MLVYKFGGSCLRNAGSFKHLKGVLSPTDDKLVMVISAFEKTTNHLENVVQAVMNKENYDPLLDEIMNFHYQTIEELFGANDLIIRKNLDDIATCVRQNIDQYREAGFDKLYDQVVPAGELMSSRVVSHYLNQNGFPNQWIDIRDSLKTDETFREARVSHELSGNLVRKNFSLKHFKFYVTQGFIAQSSAGLTTTLGREGSDYTAALLSGFLDAEKLILWKDVGAIYNCDPKLFDDVFRLAELTYQDAIELTFYGAKIIHPKTIKPLQNKGIPLYVKSFVSPDEPGTVISRDVSVSVKVPVYIVKENQVLLSITPRDLSFVVEKHLSTIFSALSHYNFKVNVMQNSAVSFSVCVDNKPGLQLKDLIRDLKKDFRILYNEDLHLITIRNYDDDNIVKMTEDQEILLEQRSRNTVQFVMKEIRN